MLRTHTDEGTFQILEQIKFLKGENTIRTAEEHGIGKREYNLIDVDEHDESDSDNKDKDDGKKPLYIVIGVISGVCLLLIVGIIVIACVRRKKPNTNVGSISLVTKEN